MKLNKTPKYSFVIEYANDHYYSVPVITKIEDEFGQYCLAYHIQELEDEIFRLRVKHNDWEDYKTCMENIKNVQRK